MFKWAKSSQLRDTTVTGQVEGKQGEENVNGRGCKVETEAELEEFEAKAEVEEYMKLHFQWLS